MSSTARLRIFFRFNGAHRFLCQPKHGAFNTMSFCDMGSSSPGQETMSAVETKKVLSLAVEDTVAALLRKRSSVAYIGGVAVFLSLTPRMWPGRALAPRDRFGACAPNIAWPGSSAHSGSFRLRPARPRKSPQPSLATSSAASDLH